MAAPCGSSRANAMFAGVCVLLLSLFLSLMSTRELKDVYKALSDFAEQSLVNVEGLSSSSSATTNGTKNNHTSTAAKDRNSGNNNNKDTSRNVMEIGKDMNIVLFYADDWTWRTVGAVNKHVKTPHIDALAKRGVLFRHNCVTTSICWQSRASKVTGLYTAVHQQLRIWDESMFDKTVLWNQTLYSQLFQAGYFSGYVGKWHAPMNKSMQAETWHLFRSIWGGHWYMEDGKMKHITEINRDDALKFLDMLHKRNEHNKTKNKFALTVAFYATHAWDPKKYPDQYVPQNYSEPLYREATMPVPKTATEEAWKNMPWFFTNGNEGRRRWRQRFDTPEHFQVTMKRIYRMASEVDDAVGVIMDKVKEMGYYNNTIFIFTTDNGNFHAEHGLADKWYPHEESIRVPLIIQDPRMPENVRGTINDEFTLNIDLAPTILSAAGLPIPKHMQGRDISQLYLGDYKKAAQNWRKDFFYEWSQGEPVNAIGHGNIYVIPAVFALVRKDYKYFYWPQAKYEQLFHVESDPFEEVDIINTTLQTKPGILEEIKARYAYLKNTSQRGFPV